MSAQIAGNITVSGIGGESASIKTRTGSLYAGGSIQFLNDSFCRADTLTLSTGGELTLEGKNTSISAHTLSLMAASSIHLSDQAQITTTEGPLTLTARDAIQLTHLASIRAEEGELRLTTLEGDILLDHHTRLYGGTDRVHISGGRSVIIDGNATVTSRGGNGLTIQVDRGRGEETGGFVLSKFASLESGEAPLNIYTAERSLNMVAGKLNGFYHEDSPLYVDTTEELWGTTYPAPPATPLTPETYHVYYEEVGPIELVAGGVTGKEFSRMLVTFIGPVTAELFRTLHPYDEYIRRAIEFNEGYECGSGTTSSNDFLKPKEFFLRKPTYRHINIPPIEKH